MRTALYSVYTLFVGYMGAKFVEKVGFHQSIPYFVMVPVMLMMIYMILYPTTSFPTVGKKIVPKEEPPHGRDHSQD